MPSARRASASDEPSRTSAHRGVAIDERSAGSTPKQAGCTDDENHDAVSLRAAWENAPGPVRS